MDHALKMYLAAGDEVLSKQQKQQRLRRQKKRRKELRRKTVRDEEVSLTWIKHTPFLPQKESLLGQTDPFTRPWPGGSQR